MTLLGMSPVFLTVKVGTVGFQNMPDAEPKGLDKCSAISTKLHVFDGFSTANGGKFFQ